MGAAKVNLIMVGAEDICSNCRVAREESVAFPPAIAEGGAPTLDAACSVGVVSRKGYDIVGVHAGKEVVQHMQAVVRHVRVGNKGLQALAITSDVEGEGLMVSRLGGMGRGLVGLRGGWGRLGRSRLCQAVGMDTSVGGDRAHRQAEVDAGAEVAGSRVGA